MTGAILASHVALNPDSAYILILRVPNALFPAKPTEGCLAVTLCAHGCLPAKIKWSDRNRMTAVPAALTLFAFFSRTRRLRVASYFGVDMAFGFVRRKKTLSSVKFHVFSRHSNRAATASKVFRKGEIAFSRSRCGIRHAAE